MHDKITNEIVRHMALAFFASAWADMIEEDETSDSLGGLEITAVMPDVIDPAALHAAQTLQFDMERANGKTLAEMLALLVQECKGEGDRPHTAEFFGHYCAMQSMGHGVGLEDSFGSKACELVEVPYVEFGAYSLEKDYTFKR